MSGADVPTQEELGRRIAQARSDYGMTQADLAASVGLERTALVRVEAGERKVSAMELVALAEALDRPIDWFFTESPPPWSAVAGTCGRRVLPETGSRPRSCSA